MTISVKQKLNTKDTFFINKTIGLGVKFINDIAYVKTTREALSGVTKVTPKTITRKLSKFGKLGLISIEHKTGVNGGIIIKLNPDEFNFENQESMLANPTETDIKLADKLFSKYTRSKGIRRTKLEIKEYNDNKRRLTERAKLDNNLLINEYAGKKALDWEFFSRTANPDEYLQIWIISRAYDSFVKSYEKKFVDSYNEYIGSGFRYGFKSPKHPYHYRSLQGAFIDSYNFKSFKKLVEMSKEMGVNPIVAMGKVFERYSYTHYTYKKYAHVPVPNQIVDKNGKRIIEESRINQRMSNRLYEGMTTDFLNNPETLAVYNLYNNVVDGSVDRSVTEKIISNFGRGSLYHYYNQVILNVKSVLSEEEVRAVKFYIEEQVNMMTDNRSLYLTQTEVGSLTLRLAIPKLLNKIDELGLEVNALSVAQENIGAYGIKPSNTNMEFMYKSIWAEVKTANNIAREVYRIYKQSTGEWYSITTLQNVLHKVAKYIPTTSTGMLNRDIVMNNY